MKELLISKYIDDELTLHEKKALITEVMNNKEFGEEIIDFIDQEIMLRDSNIDLDTELELPIQEKKKKEINKPFIISALTAVASIIIAIFFLLNQNHTTTQNIAANKSDLKKEYRFVIYQPNAKNVEIAGTFTNWKRVKMKKIDDTGYFEISMQLKPGEYKYSFVIDGKYTMPDPTVLAREEDDFGNLNSVINLSEGA